MRASEVINHVRILLGDPDADYHTDEKMLMHLNFALMDICDRSRSLRVSSYRGLIKDQSAYGLVNGFLEMDLVGVIYQGIWVELDFADLGTQLPEIFTNIFSGFSPWRYTIWGQAHDEKYVSTVVEPPIGVDDSGETFFRASEPMAGVLPGDILVNITDDSQGIVSSLSNGDLRVTFSNLSGGTNNIMAVGDQFRITSPEAGRKNLIISPPPTKTDEVGVESLFMYYSRSHQEITQKRIDDGNDNLEIDLEFASTLRHRVSYYASQDEKGIDHAATQLYDSKYETDYNKAIVPVRRRIRQFISSWRNNVKNRRSIRGQETIIRRGDWNLKPY